MSGALEITEPEKKGRVEAASRPVKEKRNFLPFLETELQIALAQNDSLQNELKDLKNMAAPYYSVAPALTELGVIECTLEEYNAQVNFYYDHPRQTLRYLVDSSNTRDRIDTRELMYLKDPEDEFVIACNAWDSIINMRGTFQKRAIELLCQVLKMDCLPYLSLSGRNMDHAPIMPELMDTIIEIMLPARNDPGRPEKIRRLRGSISNFLSTHHEKRIKFINEAEYD